MSAEGVASAGSMPEKPKNKYKIKKRKLVTLVNNFTCMENQTLRMT